MRPNKRTRESTLAPHQRTTLQLPKQCQHTHIYIEICGNTAEGL